jgi:hypothetical protein
LCQLMHIPLSLKTPTVSPLFLNVQAIDFLQFALWFSKSENLSSNSGIR